MVPIQNRAIAKKIRQEKQKELKNTIQNWSDRKGCQYSGDNLEKIHKDDILKLFHDFNDDISQKFGSSYVIIDYFSTWGFHFGGDHCSEWTLVKECEQRLKIYFCLWRLG